LKHDADNPQNAIDDVAGRHPLKQGLKPYLRLAAVHIPERRRAASTKTRIETRIDQTRRYALLRRRAASTKTRIETCTLLNRHILDEYVAGRHPLKQGLKLHELIVPLDEIERRRAASTKTRIETL